MAKQRTVSQVVLQIFKPLSCISVPLKTHGELCHKWFFRFSYHFRAYQFRSSFHTTFMRISSVQSPWPSGEPCRKWFFKSSYHFHAYRYPFRAQGQAASCVASGFSSLHTTFMRVDIRLRPKAMRRTVSQVVLQVFIPLSCILVSGPGPRPSSKPCRKWFFKSAYDFHAYRNPF